MASDHRNGLRTLAYMCCSDNETVYSTWDDLYWSLKIIGNVILH